MNPLKTQQAFILPFIDFAIMKISINKRHSLVSKIVIVVVFALIAPENVCGIWDFSRPTNNPLQAAVGGLALGAAGALAVNYFKRGRGKRDADFGVRNFL